MNKQSHMDKQKFIYSFSCIVLLLFLGVIFYFITILLQPISEQPKLQPFLKTEGQFSLSSSNLGMSVSVDPLKNIPDKYIIEWHITGGKILQWDKDKKQLKEIKKFHRYHLMTVLNDGNHGAILWVPNNVKHKKKLTLKAYLYKNEKATKPLFYDKITLIKKDGITFEVQPQKSKNEKK